MITHLVSIVYDVVPTGNLAHVWMFFKSTQLQVIGFHV